MPGPFHPAELTIKCTNDYQKEGQNPKKQGHPGSRQGYPKQKPNFTETSPLCGLPVTSGSSLQESPKSYFQKPPIAPGLPSLCPPSGCSWTSAGSTHGNPSELQWDLIQHLEFGERTFSCCFGFRCCDSEVQMCCQTVQVPAPSIQPYWKPYC